MNTKSFPFIRPVFPHPSEYTDDLLQMAKNNWYTNNGPFVQKFEQELANYLNLKDHEVIASCNATIALMLVFKQYLKDPTKNVAILPSFTFAATAQALKWAGWELKYIDVDPFTMTISVATLEESLTPKVGLIVPVCAFGNSPDLDSLLQVAGAIPIVLDAAPALETRYNSQSIAIYGAASIFSLHATKNLPVGEGAFIVTKSSDSKILREAKNFGFDDQKCPTAYGTNAKLSEISAIIGLHGLQKINQFQQVRHLAANTYRSILGDLVGYQYILPNAYHAYQTFPIVCPIKYRDELVRYLADNSIIARKYYDPPLHTVIKDCVNTSRLPNTTLLSSSVVCLPIYADMTIEETEYIAEKVKDFFQKHRK